MKSKIGSNETAGEDALRLLTQIVRGACYAAADLELTRSEKPLTKALEETRDILRETTVFQIAISAEELREGRVPISLFTEDPAVAEIISAILASEARFVVSLQIGQNTIYRKHQSRRQAFPDLKALAGSLKAGSREFDPLRPEEEIGIPSARLRKGWVLLLLPDEGTSPTSANLGPACGLLIQNVSSSQALPQCLALENAPDVLDLPIILPFSVSDEVQELPAYLDHFKQSGGLILPLVHAFGVGERQIDSLELRPRDHENLRLIRLVNKEARNVEGILKSMKECIEAELSLINSDNALPVLECAPPRKAQPIKPTMNSGRGSSDPALQILNDELSALGKNLEERSRHLLLPKGDYHELARTQAGRISEQDLEFVDDQKSSRVSFKRESAEQLQQSILRRLVADLSAEAGLIDEAIETAVQEALDTSGIEAGDGASSVKVPRFPVERLLDFADTLTTNPMEYGGDIPRVSTLAFVWQTIQHPVMILFTLMMPMSLFMSSEKIGPLLRRIRFDVAIFALAPLYIGTPFFLAWKFRHERHLALRRELERMRKTARSDLEKTLRGVVDEKKRLLADHLRSSTEQLRRQIWTLIHSVKVQPDEAGDVQETQPQASAFNRKKEQRAHDLVQRRDQCAQLRQDLVRVQDLVRSAFPPAT